MENAITPGQFHEAEGTADWRVLGDGAAAFFRTKSFTDAARLVTAIAQLPAVDVVSPDIDVRADGVSVRLLTIAPDYCGMTRRDLEFAREVSEAARSLGLTADPSVLQSLLIIPEGPSVVEIMPFWQAALGYEPREDSPKEDLVDPHRRGTPLWLETLVETHPGRAGAVHVAVWVPHDNADARLAAALAAGGRMVRDQFAPAWWTLADTAGNEVDIATSMSRT